MATDTAGTVARDYGKQMIHYLRKTITYADAGTEVTVGWVPSGALLVQSISGVHVTTAFNSSGTDLIDIGGNTGNDDPDDYATDLDVSTVGFKAIDEALGTAVNPTTADTEITVTYAQSVADASAGVAEVVIAYIPDNDG